ncbi:MAG: methyltransferase domain-containing protein [Syntrophobacterales bacterium]|jgi:heptosyltransferase-2
MSSEKRLASVRELRSEHYTRFMQQLNHFAAEAELHQYTTYSRVWEYPWLWSKLESLKGQGLRVLDLGSERSPIQWFLATQGFRVIVSDINAQHWRVWRRASKKLGLSLSRRIIDAQNVDLPAASVDIYLSVSVIEHVEDKVKAMMEAARVLRPGGLLIMTFDICEPDMGMSFPEWNGRALTMREFDELFRDSSWFDPEISRLRWNAEDIPEYYSWHRNTAPHHNYITGAAVVRRNERVWLETARTGRFRSLRGQLRTATSVALWPIVSSKQAVRNGMARFIKSPGEKGRSFPILPRLSVCVGASLFKVLGRRQKGGRLNPERVQRALVVRLDAIGDVIMTTPFLRELRKFLPGAWITLVIRPALFNLVELCPYVNEILSFDCHVRGSLKHLRLHMRTLDLARKRFWNRPFDLAIVPRWDADIYHAAFVASSSGATWRLAYSEHVNESKSELNKGYDQLFTHILDDKTLKHEVEHSLEIVRYLGGAGEEERLEVWLSPEDHAMAENLLQSHEVSPDDLLIALGPGAGDLRRMWPLGNVAELGTWLKEKYNASLLVVGGSGEEYLGHELERQLSGKVINSVGRTTLRQVCALLRHCQLYIGNDTGAMHLASAAGVSVVEISCHPLNGSRLHANSPRRFGPWGVDFTVLQPEKAIEPCSEGCTAAQAHCIKTVTVADVKHAVEKHLSGRERCVSTLS